MQLVLFLGTCKRLLFRLKQNDIDGCVLASMTADDLKAIGITSFGDVRKIQLNLQQSK